MTGFLDKIVDGRFERPDPADWLAKYRDMVVEPRFDRIAVRAMSMFDSVPRRKPTLRPSIDEPLDALFGIPVSIDEAVEPGVIELRKGDEVVERVRLEQLLERSFARPGFGDATAGQIGAQELEQR